MFACTVGSTELKFGTELGLRLEKVISNIQAGHLRQLNLAKWSNGLLVENYITSGPIRTATFSNLAQYFSR